MKKLLILLFWAATTHSAKAQMSLNPQSPILNPKIDTIFTNGEKLFYMDEQGNTKSDTPPFFIQITQYDPLSKTTRFAYFVVNIPVDIITWKQKHFLTTAK